jgi:hypothetical protein
MRAGAADTRAYVASQSKKKQDDDLEGIAFVGKACEQVCCVIITSRGMSSHDIAQTLYACADTQGERPQIYRFAGNCTALRSAHAAPYMPGFAATARDMCACTRMR